MFERRGSVATEASFANAGFLAPGLRHALGRAGHAAQGAGATSSRDAAVRMAGLPGPALVSWLWRWWRACDAAPYAGQPRRDARLAHDSLARTQALAQAHSIDHEHGQGVLVLLRASAKLPRRAPA